MRTWSAATLAQALDSLTQAEIDCKTTGLPAVAVCGQALMAIAAAARRQQRA
jgi:DNA polymerase-3 subunit delta